MLSETGMLLLLLAVLCITLAIYWDPILQVDKCISKVKQGKKLSRIDILFLSLLYGSPRKIVISNELKDNSNVHYPLTEQEIRSVINSLYQKCPLAVMGIKSIHIVQRPIDLKKSIVGAYFTNSEVLNGAIHLYPLTYIDGLYLHNFFNKETGSTSQRKADEQLTKYSLIHTLLHEIGHHFRFAINGDLHGDEVEKYCDQFAAKWTKELNLTPGIEQTRKMIQEFELNQLRKQIKAYEERLKELDRLLEEKEKSGDESIKT